MNQSLTKRPPPKQSNTIDEKHTEMLNQFYENEMVLIPKLQEEKTRLKSLIPNLKENEIDTYMDIRDKINDINTQIKNLKYQKKHYLLDNSKYIFQYFEEKKKWNLSYIENTKKYVSKDKTLTEEIESTIEELNKIKTHVVEQLNTYFNHIEKQKKQNNITVNNKKSNNNNTTLKNKNHKN